MNTNKKTVLVVDDTPANIQLVSGLLRERYKVKAATSGEKALKIARADPPPDLILLDVMMPEMDGHEVCRHLQNDPVTQAIPVIFLTGNDDEQERREGLALGAVDYISKPVDPADLEARVQTWTTR
jgi:CheY-like chemotaxis protein